MKRNTDFTKLIRKEHENKWVALNQSQDKVLDCDEQLAPLVKKMKSRADKPVYMKVPPFDAQLAF